MTAWMVMALLGVTLMLPIFDGDDAADEDTGDDMPATPETDPVPPTDGTVIDGTDGSDTIEATANETINGLAGADSLSASEGSDGAVLNGGDGNDTLSSFGQNATVNGGAGQDTITFQGSPASTGAQVVNGGDGDDTINAFGEGGTVMGGGGEDVIDAQGPLDGVFGGPGNDRITADTSDSGGVASIEGGSGNDVIALTESAGASVQTLVDAGVGDDRITTENFAIPGPVSTFDILTGGSGVDVFEMTFISGTFDPAAAADLGTVVQITDFNAAEDQLVVDLSAFDVFAAQIDAPTNTSFEIVERADGSGSDVVFNVINADANGPLTGTIALEGVAGLVPEDVSLVFSGLEAAS